MVKSSLVSMLGVLGMFGCCLFQQPNIPSTPSQPVTSASPNSQATPGTPPTTFDNTPSPATNPNPSIQPTVPAGGNSAPQTGTPQAVLAVSPPYILISGESSTETFEVSPSNVTSITATSSNSAIATVALLNNPSTFQVTAHASGECTITVNANNQIINVPVYVNTVSFSIQQKPTESERL